MKKKTLLMSLSAIALICGIASCAHEHEFASDWSKDDTHHWHAAICEHTEEVSGKSEHTWDAGTVTKEATEAAKGEKTFKCTVCEATKTEEIAQLEHTHKFATEWSSDATHHWHASTCGHDDAVIKEAHTWGEAEVTVQPTFTSEGSQEIGCTICDYTKTEVLPKLEAKLVLNANDLEAGSIAPGTVVEHAGFTLITDNPAQEAEKIDKEFTVDEISATIGEEEFTQRIKTNGGSSTKLGAEERVISFATTGKGVAKVYAKHGSTDETKPSAKVSVFNVEEGVQHDSAEITVGSEPAIYELDFHYGGTFYIASTANISIYKIEVTWEDGVNDTTWQPETTLEDPNVLNVTDIAPQTIESDVTWGNFVVHAGTEADSQHVVVDTGGAKSYDGVSYTGRLKLGGLGTVDYRSVTINVEQASTITIVVMSSSSSKDRTANLFGPDGNPVLDTDATVLGSSVKGLIFEVSEAGAYNFRVTGGDGGANIYAIMIEENNSTEDPGTEDPGTEDPGTEDPGAGTPVEYELDYSTLSDALTEATQFGFFTLTLNVKSESLKIAGASYAEDELTFERQISLTKGKVTTAANGISFTVEAGKTAIVTVYAAQKADKTTSLNVLDSSGNKASISNLTIDGVAATEFDVASITEVRKYVFELSEGTYHLGGAGGGIYVYGLNVVIQ